MDTTTLEINERVIAERDLVEFAPEDIEDARKKIARQINQRQGQQKFRKDLLEAYHGECAITGTRIQQILEAAHIIPYKGKDTNHIQNGILLRTDIHTLFDLQLLHIHPTKHTVILDKQLYGTDYWQLNGKKIKLPSNTLKQPSSQALAMRLGEVKDYD